MLTHNLVTILLDVLDINRNCVSFYLIISTYVYVQAILILNHVVNGTAKSGG